MSSEVAVLIGTGAIGIAIARRAAVGRTLLLADVSQPLLDEASTQLGAEGYDVKVMLVDVASRESVDALAHAASQLGSVARVIHTAGVSPVQASTERVIAVDLLGMAFVLEEFGRIISKNGSGVVISSMAGYMGAPLAESLERRLGNLPLSELADMPELAPDAVGDSGAAYGLAKRANSLRVRHAAIAWGERGARVNSLSPGIIASPLAFEEMAGPHAARYQHMIDTSAAKRMGTPADVADLAQFVLEPTGSFITGSDFLIDGGVIAAMKGTL